MRDISSGALGELNGSTELRPAIMAMCQLLGREIKTRSYLVSSFDPGAGKTGALCAFLRSWKSSGFQPPSGVLVVLSTRKEIESCIHRADLEPSDFAVLVQKGLELNEKGRPDADSAPILFTTQEKLRRLCYGRSFAEVTSLHFLGRPRALRVWDEAFLPASPATIRKDTLVSALEELRPIAPFLAEDIEALAASLGTDGSPLDAEVPSSIRSVYAALRDHLGTATAERWAPLQGLAGRTVATVNGGSKGLCLAGGGSPLPADFAPALILDASGRVRETYKTMEANGLLQRLPSASTDYSRLTLHHWDRAASRSTLKDPIARREIMKTAAAVINESAPDERWLIIHPKARAWDGFDAFEELCSHVAGPERLSSLHWGNHHGTNEYRDIRKVIVLGLWTLPLEAYTALHLAAGDRWKQPPTRRLLMLSGLESTNITFSKPYAAHLSGRAPEASAESVKCS